MSFKNNQWIDDRETVYVVIVSHNNGSIAIVETHTCIKRVQYRINKLERMYRTGPSTTFQGDFCHIKTTTTSWRIT